MKNILSVFMTMPVGGAEILWLNVLKKLDRSRFNPITCCVIDNGEIGEMIECMGYEVVSLGRKKTNRFDSGAVKGMKALILEKEIDVVHAHMYHAALYSRLGALMAGNQRPKVVYSIHNVYNRPKLHRIAANMVLGRFTDLVIAVAGPVKDDIVRYDRIPEKKVTVLENGIDFDRFDIALSKKEAKERLGLSGADFVLGCVARLDEAKGHAYMLRTASMLKKSGHNFKFILVGSGRLEEELKRECVNLGMESDVIFLGTRHDIPELYKAMDIYLMSSLWEGSSLSIMDALAAGLPTVVTEVGGSADIVDHGRCGLLVPPKDPKAMADAIIKLYGSSGKRNELAEHGKERARKLYSSDAMTKKLEELYEALFRTEGPT